MRSAGGKMAVQALIAHLWIVALLGLGVSGLALQRRFASLRSLLTERRPDLAGIVDRGNDAGRPLPLLAVLQWLLGGAWRQLHGEPLIQAYAATCLRLLRLTLAWLIGLLATLVL